MVIKTQPFKIYEMLQKQFLEGSSEQYRPSSEEKKNLKFITTHHLKELEKEGQIKPKASRRKELIKIRKEINKTEIQKTIEKNQ